LILQPTALGRPYASVQMASEGSQNMHAAMLLVSIFIIFSGGA
jgi:hypothetical protein